MADLVVDGLDDDLVQLLEERARREGRSAEEEHRRILEEALRPEEQAQEPDGAGQESWEGLSQGGPVS